MRLETKSTSRARRTPPGQRHTVRASAVRRVATPRESAPAPSIYRSRPIQFEAKKWLFHSPVPGLRLVKAILGPLDMPLFLSGGVMLASSLVTQASALLLNTGSFSFGPVYDFFIGMVLVLGANFLRSQKQTRSRFEEWLRNLSAARHELIRETAQLKKDFPEDQIYIEALEGRLSQNRDWEASVRDYFEGNWIDPTPGDLDNFEAIEVEIRGNLELLQMHRKLRGRLAARSETVLNQDSDSITLSLANRALNEHRPVTSWSEYHHQRTRFLNSLDLFGFVYLRQYREGQSKSDTIRLRATGMPNLPPDFPVLSNRISQRLFRFMRRTFGRPWVGFTLAGGAFLSSIAQFILHDNTSLAQMAHRWIFDTSPIGFALGVLFVFATIIFSRKEPWAWANSGDFHESWLPQMTPLFRQVLDNFVALAQRKDPTLDPILRETAQVLGDGTTWFGTARQHFQERRLGKLNQMGQNLYAQLVRTYAFLKSSEGDQRV